MGMILLAGVGAAAIFRLLPNRPMKLVAAIVLAAGAGHLGWQAYQLSFNPRYLADPLNPYVYAHTPTPLPKTGRATRSLGRAGAGRPRYVDPGGGNRTITGRFPGTCGSSMKSGSAIGSTRNVWKRDREHYPPPAILILSSDIDSDDLTDAWRATMAPLRVAPARRADRSLYSQGSLAGIILTARRRDNPPHSFGQSRNRRDGFAGRLSGLLHKHPCDAPVCA